MFKHLLRDPARVNAMKQTCVIIILAYLPYSNQIHTENAAKTFKLGDFHIQNIYLGRYIIRYKVGNLVLWRRASGAVKRDFRLYIRRYTSPNEYFEYGYPHSNALLQILFKLKRCRAHNASHHPTKCDIINDVKLFPIVYCWIYCRKFSTLSNQKSPYKSKCIRKSLFLHWISLNKMASAVNF